MLKSSNYKTKSLRDLKGVCSKNSPTRNDTKIHPLIFDLKDNPEYKVVARGFIPFPFIKGINPKELSHKTYTLFASGATIQDFYQTFHTCLQCNQGPISEGMLTLELIYINNDSDGFNKARCIGRILCKSCEQKVLASEDLKSRANQGQLWVKTLFTPIFHLMITPILEKIQVTANDLESCLMCQKPMDHKLNNQIHAAFCSNECMYYYNEMQRIKQIIKTEDKFNDPLNLGDIVYEHILASVANKIKKECIYDYIKENGGNLCQYCAAPYKMACSKCMGIRFCSQKCEVDAWEWHKSACHDWKLYSQGKIVFLEF